MAHHITHTNPSSLVFPLPGESVQYGTDIFKEYVDDELNAITAGNIEMLEEENPTRYLLEGNARAHLPPEIPLFAYQTGVCIGTTIVRRRVRRLANDNGGFIEEPRLEPGMSPVFGPEVVRRWVPQPIRRLLQYEADRYHISARPAEFFADPEDMMYIGTLKAAWIGQNVGFLSLKGINRYDDDYFMLGFGDSLALHAYLYDVQAKKRG